MAENPSHDPPGTEPPARRNFLGSGNDAFVCGHCSSDVLPLANGSFRNHCPHCLWSRHVDVVPGDRASSCGGLMEPVAVEGSSAGGWKITQRCVDCGHERANVAALDDPRQPDDWDALADIASG